MNLNYNKIVKYLLGYFYLVNFLILKLISYQAFFPFYGPVYQFGINYFTVYGSILCSSTVKLKSGGRGAPFGKVVV